MLWIVGFGLAGAAALLRLHPAQLRHARVVRQEAVADGNYTLVYLAWSYHRGTRPTSLIIDLTDSRGQSGSLTVDGASDNGRIPLAAPLATPCTLSITSVHRLAGFPRETRQTFEQPYIAEKL